MRLPILAYHKIDDPTSSPRFPRNCVRIEQFSEQVRYLRLAGYRSITFEQYLAYRSGTGDLPRRPILLSFDDGYASVFENARPILRAAGFAATVFLVSGQIAGYNAWDPAEKRSALLDFRQIAMLQQEGFEFQSHTVSHQRLTGVPPETALEELRESRAALQALLGASVRVICYPFAAHSAGVEDLARSAGYELGVTIRRRLNRESTNPMALRRIPVTFETSLARFAWDLFRLRFRSD